MSSTAQATLVARLRALAEDAEQAPWVDTAAAARRRATTGRRRARRGTLGVLVAAGAVLALLVASVAERSQPDLAAAREVPGLPDRLDAPSPWLPGTEEAGELDRLAAVVVADRGSWSGSDRGVVGVSATTGEQRFLDLPDDAGLRPTVSPDGRLVAYWATGHELDGAPASWAGDGEVAVTGVAAYDVDTGDVVDLDLRSEHGVAPDRLVWAGSDRLLMTYGDARGGDGEPGEGTSEVAELHAWDIARGGNARLSTDVLASATEDAAVVDREGAWRRVPLLRCRPTCVVRSTEGELMDPATSRRAGVYAPPVLDPSQERIAFLGRDRSPGPVLVHGPDGLSVAPGSAGTTQVLRWLGRDDLLLLQDPDPRGEVTPDLRVLDLVTGEPRTLVDVDDALGAEVVPGDVAIALAELPTFPAPDPARPLDPRLVAAMFLGFLGVVGVGGVIGVLLLRRRRRA